MAAQEKVLKVRLGAGRLGRTDLVVLGCFERGEPAVGGLPARLQATAREAAGRRGFRAEEGQVALLRSTAPGHPYVAVLGLGKRKEFGAEQLAAWLERAAARARDDGYQEALFVPPDHPAAAGEGAALALLRQLALAGYRFDAFRQAPPRRGLKRVALLPPAGEEEAYRRALPLAAAIAAGVVRTRELGNTPPNEATPSWMADSARAWAAKWDAEIEVLGPKELAARGMGGILAVGSGSSHPPRLVRLAWGDGPQSIAVVGKGVTFDTGGISIKPSASMDEMKFDKSGATTALGIAAAVARLELPVRLSVYLPLAENMPDGASYRPGDIVRCYNGKTVEILNTDAEGRMILADALSWAAESRPDVLLDFATLTGACVVALGGEGAGLFCQRDDLAGELLGAADAAREKVWRLPLWPEFGREMKGQHADLRNTGGRWGGASLAAAFLANFVGDVRRWAHFDIAGPAFVGRTQKERFGATGFGVATAATWLLRRTGRL